VCSSDLLARGIVHREDMKNKVDEEQRIEMLYEICFQRQPTPLETKIGMKFLEEQSGIKTADVKPVWQYGYGQYNARTRQVAFFRLPNYVSGAGGGRRAANMAAAGGGHYDGGTNSRLAGLKLDAGGGSPGLVPVIRRFTSPVDGTLNIDGPFSIDGKAPGDGVNGYIVHSRGGQVASFNLSGKVRSVEAKVAKVEVKKGDTIDFIVDNGGRGSYVGDEFKWSPTLGVAANMAANAKGAPAAMMPASPFGTSMPAPAAGAAMPAAKMNNMGGAMGGGGSSVWNAGGGFAGPNAGQQRPLDTWEKYAQMLLLANEMTFVD